MSTCNKHAAYPVPGLDLSACRQCTIEQLQAKVADLQQLCAKAALAIKDRRPADIQMNVPALVDRLQAAGAGEVQPAVNPDIPALGSPLLEKLVLLQSDEPGAPALCNAELHIADDYGDNHATMRCQLPVGHEGPHEERFDRAGPAVITWACDEREPDPEPCPCANTMGEHACENRHQCWEPCGELGKSEAHAVASGVVLPDGHSEVE